MLKCFKRHGTDISSGTMAVGTIVINFNIFEYSLTHLFTSDKALTVDGLNLQVISLTHFWFGTLALKFWASGLGATGRSCFELVVALYFLLLWPVNFAAAYWQPRFCGHTYTPDCAVQEPGGENLSASSAQQRLQQPACQELCACCCRFVGCPAHCRKR